MQKKRTKKEKCKMSRMDRMQSCQSQLILSVDKMPIDPVFPSII
jgi:hypothetical protein